MNSLVDLLCYRNQNQGNEIAFTFLPNGETEEIHLSYQELDVQARAIAAQLQSLTQPGQRALLLYQPGLEFISAFFGCLYAGVVAVPLYPPRRNHHSDRLEAIVVDAQATVALTTTFVLQSITKQIEKKPALENLTWLTTDNIDHNPAQDWQAPSIAKDTLAFIQYTSGSTGKPKGVMISQGNLLHNSAMIHQCFNHQPHSQGVIWLPPYHDMGLIGGVLQPIYGGFPVTLMPPAAFIQKPIRWLKAISHYQATTSGGPNFAYDMCVKKVKPEQLETLDLSHWQVAFTGAEPIRAQTLAKFTRTFADCGFRPEAFYPCYGMAESTLFIAGGLSTEEPIIRSVEAKALLQNRVVPTIEQDEKAQAIVGCGHSWLEQKIVIVNPESLTQCQEKEVGEIWVSGASIAQGYWGEESQKTFQAYLPDTQEGPFLRTGDLGFFDAGELFITGRIKDTIIIRGQNHYPQDIESTVQQSHESLRPDCGAAFSLEIKGAEELIIVQEVERTYMRKINVKEVIGDISQAVTAKHGLRAYAVLLVKVGSIPKTTSGKIQRYACKNAFINDNLQLVEDRQKKFEKIGV
ncbi:MAG: fatty acyl-AMP ligase [Cyanobacteria bacterium P01_F01_bin.143]